MAWMNYTNKCPDLQACKLDIEFLQPGGSTSSRAAATAVELQFAL